MSDTREWYVLTTTGDGAQCFIVPGDKLPDAVHEELCLCDENWRACTTEGVKELVQSLSDDNAWSREYPGAGHYKWGTTFEDGSITVVRLTDLSFIAYAEAENAELSRRVQELERELEYCRVHHMDAGALYRTNLRSKRVALPHGAQG